MPRLCLLVCLFVSVHSTSWGLDSEDVLLFSAPFSPVTEKQVILEVPRQKVLQTKTGRLGQDIVKIDPQDFVKSSESWIKTHGDYLAPVELGQGFAVSSKGFSELDLELCFPQRLKVSDYTWQFHSFRINRIDLAMSRSAVIAGPSDLTDRYWCIVTFLGASPKDSMRRELDICFFQDVTLIEPRIVEPSKGEMEARSFFKSGR